jgi:hypothetical protein
VTRERFDTIWVSRLGAEGADDLWRWRRRTKAYMMMPFIAGGGSLLLGLGVLGDLGAVVLYVVAVGLLVDFIMGMRRLKAAMSERFGVHVKGFPPMNQRAFDRWTAYNGYRQPDE